MPSILIIKHNYHHELFIMQRYSAVELSKLIKITFDKLLLWNKFYSALIVEGSWGKTGSKDQFISKQSEALDTSIVLLNIILKLSTEVIGLFISVQILPHHRT